MAGVRLLFTAAGVLSQGYVMQPTRIPWREKSATGMLRGRLKCETRASSFLSNLRKDMSLKKAHGHDTKHVKIARNCCFGCGQDNPEGMRLKFKLDEERESFVSRFRLSQRYVGPPGHAHGGVIATILDEAMGKVNKLRHVVAVTAEMTVQYIKPVPLGKPLIAEGWGKSVRGRVHTNVAEIRDKEGMVLARSTGTFIAIDPHAMFGKHLRKGQGGQWTKKQLRKSSRTSSAKKRLSS